MPYCPNCGVGVDETDRYCWNCGIRLEDHGIGGARRHEKQIITHPLSSLGRRLDVKDKLLIVLVIISIIYLFVVLGNSSWCLSMIRDGQKYLESIDLESTINHFLSGRYNLVHDMLVDADRDIFFAKAKFRALDEIANRIIVASIVYFAVMLTSIVLYLLMRKKS